MIVLPRREDNKCENIVIHKDDKYMEIIDTWRFL